MKYRIRDKYLFGLWSLIIVGFLIRLYMAHIDPFLHIWDERFHALVARNMLDQPFVPMLRAHPMFPADPASWTQGHIWLHKQPLFMWQMALSMKIFGVTEYAVRYPSVLMGTLMIPLTYSIVLSLSSNKAVSLMTAGLFCFSNFHLELVGGMRSMDHNDLALEFYVLVSVWSWIKHERSGKWYWAILTGLFSGCAVLTKWLIGLFVFLLWGIKLLFKIRNVQNYKEIFHFLGALLICCIVFIPWQLYIINHFPVEAAHEYAFNNRHITEALEGHSGTIFFYLQRFPQLFGEGIFLLIFPGVYLYCTSKERDGSFNIPLFIGILFVFSFFSFLVQTKVISHMFFIAPLLMMFMAYSIIFIIGRMKKRYLMIFFIVGLGILSCKPEKIILDQCKKNEERTKNIADAEVYKNLKNKLPTNISLVLNVADCPSLMFYNKDLTAYEMLSEQQIESLKIKKCFIAVFKNDKQNLPEYIVRYPYLFIIAQ